MLWQLIKFKIKTTYKGIAFLLLGVYVALIPEFVVFYQISPSTMYKLALADKFDIYAIIFLSLIFLGQNFSPSFFIQKSDVDFLFMVPIDEKEIEIAYSLSAFLITLFQTIFAVILLFPIISYFSILVGLLVSILHSFSFFAFKGKRKIVVPIIATWMLSSIAKFPFTPFSMVFGYVYGYFILAGLDFITVLLGIKNANIEDLIYEFYKREGLLTPKGRITTSVSLFSSSSFVVMLKMNFNFFEIGGIIGGIPYIISRRVEIYKVVATTSAIAITIYVFVRTAEYALASSIVALVGFLIILLTSSSAFANEPLWLNLSVMTPIEYARKYLLAKTLSVFTAFLPISISLLLLNPATGAGSLLIPFVYIYSASIAARFNRSSIIGVRILIANLLLLLSLIPIALDVFFTIAGAITTLAFTLPFLISKGYWEKTFEKAITSL